MFAAVVAMPVSCGSPAIGTQKPKNLTNDEIALLERLDYDHAWSQLEYLSGLGEKTAGSEEERAAQEYVHEQLSDMPLDEVWWEEFRVANWDHHGTTVDIVLPDGVHEGIDATTYGDSPSVWGYDDGTPYYHGNSGDGKTLTARVVDVGYGTAADFDAACPLDGAIALVHRDDNTQGWPNVPASDAAFHGASAVMFYGYFTGADNPVGIKQDSVFSPIPAISISPNSAARIQALLDEYDGDVEIEISGQVDFYPDARSVNVAGVLMGTTRADEYVVISGHIDTWWWGSFDDCSSIAIMLEMARMFSEARESGEYVNERTLVFCSVGSEESGGPDGTWFNWLIGSYEFVCAHPDIMDGLVLELNIDGGSFPKVGGKVWLEISIEVSAFVWSAISDLGYLNVLNCYTPVWTWTDAWSFAGKGGGTAIEMVWGTGFDPYYHTQLDSIELQSEDMVAMVMELTALMAFRSVNALVVPLDFVPVCDWASQYLAKERPMVPSQRSTVDAALAALLDLESLYVSINEKAAEIEEMYSSAMPPLKKAKVMEMADELNRAIIDARRIFIPWTMGEGGMMASWEPFMRPHQHATDHMAVASAILALESGDTTAAATALESVRSMEWGMYCGREAYLDVYGQMMYCAMYWGDDFDQAQDYIDIQGVYLGLTQGSMTIDEALAELESARLTLEGWFTTDVLKLELEWGNAAVPLEAVLQ